MTSLSLFTFMHWRRKWQPTPVFLPGESQGWRAWWAAVYGVAQSRTRLKRLSSSSSSKAVHCRLPRWSSGKEFVCRCRRLQGKRKRPDKWLAGCHHYPFFTWQIFAAAAAKSLQSCLTLCNPIDGSPSASAVPGILQARTLEWVAISFSNA